MPPPPRVWCRKCGDPVTDSETTLCDPCADEAEGDLGLHQPANRAARRAEDRSKRPT